jgi:hypothetical protein
VEGFCELFSICVVDVYVCKMALVGEEAELGGFAFFVAWEGADEAVEEGGEV